MTGWMAPVGATVEWRTPRSVFDALGLDFDLDPASPPGGVPWIPAARFVDREEDGLSIPWTGRVWLNPPYGRDLPRFVGRMATHRNGVALLPSRTETRWWQSTALTADAVCFLDRRLHFVRVDGTSGRSDHPSCLMAWGAMSYSAVVRCGLGWTVTRNRLAPR